MSRIEEKIIEIELDYLSKVSATDEERLKMLPLSKLREIKALIWNVTNNKKYKISYKDFSQIIDIFLERLKKVS